MQQTLPYGSGHLSFALAAGRFVSRLEPLQPGPRRSAVELIARALQEPIGTRPLREIARGKRSAAIRCRWITSI